MYTYIYIYIDFGMIHTNYIYTVYPCISCSKYALFDGHSSHYPFYWFGKHTERSRGHNMLTHALSGFHTVHTVHTSLFLIRIDMDRILAQFDRPQPKSFEDRSFMSECGFSDLECLRSSSEAPKFGPDSGNSQIHIQQVGGIRQFLSCFDSYELDLSSSL